MVRRRSRPLRRIAAAATILFARATSLFPLPACRVLGRAIGLVAYYLVPRVRKVGLDNVDRAYGEALTAREKQAIARHAAMNMGIVAAEFSHVPQLPSERGRTWFDVEGIENWDPARGCLFISGHMGNWEWMFGMVASAGIRVAGVVRPLDDRRLDEYVDRARRSAGSETISKSDAGPELIRRIREGRAVGLLIDQSPRDNGVPATFFGRACWATVAPAMIALRTNCPIHLLSNRRHAGGRYTLSIHPPIEIRRSGNLRDDLSSVSQQCQDVLERIVREDPGNWLWMHRRWKDRPRLAREWAERQSRAVKAGGATIG